MPRQLKHNGFARGGAGEGSSGSGARGSASILVLALVAIALLALSRLDHSLVRSARIALADGAAPILRVAMFPFDPLQRAWRRVADLWMMQSELERLRAEVERLESWEGRAKEFARRSAELEKIAKAVPEAHLPFATVRVIAGSTSPFVRTAMIDAGHDHAMKPGYPAINADGLVGRLLATGPTSSRLLLLNDFNSRIPVMIGPDSVRAMLVGDNGPFPRIQHVAPGETIKPGDDVVTSGVGGIFPRALRVGVVVDTGEELRIELKARLDRLEYVSILFYEQNTLDSAGDDPDTRGRVRSRKLPPEPSATVFQRAKRADE